ncbi:MAG: TetR/AcrR family transcriptional regulator [Bacteroidetes bacterium HGW-Bacteroidetes-4]|jgi:AcrR family transcriptional regulator|nr:MAG: TetR/AcrR family transcriptional regulator [Bacteroidetes bacterium HGW-Bacteroidetes-4]
MTEKEKHTEDKIVEAAKTVFIEKGMQGARMQEIADQAGINKSLLHYYFRTKEKLFDFIFNAVLGKIGSIIGKIMNEDLSIEEKVAAFVEGYSDLLLKNPFLPNFIINEITRNPEAIINRFKKSNIEPQHIFGPLKKQLQDEGYYIEPADFIVNLLSLVIFPIVAKPIIESQLFDKDDRTYKQFINERKTSVVKFIMAGLKAYS